MKITVLGGAGAMGQVAVKDLVESKATKEVVIADFSLEKANEIKEHIGSAKIQTTFADLNDKSSLVKAFTGSAVVINSTPYQFNVKAMEAALDANCHYLDLGGLFHVTRKQLELHDKFKQKNLLAILGMGAAPGLTNVMARYAADDLDTVETIDMIVAGVDFTKHNHPCLPPYALDTILDEYVMEPWVFEDGEFKAKPALSGEMTLDLPKPVGRVSAFLTIHSEIATLPLTYKNKGIKQVTYRLGLPEDFHHKMKFLAELGFGSKDSLDIDGQKVFPRKVLAKILEQHPVPTSDPSDAEVVRVDVYGKKDNKSTLVRMETVVLSDKNWNLSCGALDTGVPPSIVAQLIASGIIKERGVLPPESSVPALAFFEEMAKRNMVVYKIIDDKKIDIVKQPVVLQ
jgi:saccharopine dehydrogenase-like NADP-dependent oxidoreductase